MRGSLGASVVVWLALAAGCGSDDGSETSALSEAQTTSATGQGTDSSTTQSTGSGTSATTSSTTSGGTTDSSASASSTSTTSGSTGDGGDSTGQLDDLDPPAGQSSGGAGGGQASGEVRMAANGVVYRVIAPGSAGPHPAMIVYSGTEGGPTMTTNILNLATMTGNDGTVFGVLDGTDYFGDGSAGATVLDELRAQYDIDNDRTYLLSESAGTSAGLQLGLQLRQSYFAAYWANDVNAQAAPSVTAEDLGFAPFGNAGPGGDFVDANAIVQGMMAAGYRTPAPAPYDGPGADTHGSPQQFIAAMQWFPGKTRQ